MKTEIRFYFEHPNHELQAIQNIAKKLFCNLIECGVVIEESAVESREDLDLLSEDWEDPKDPVAVSKGDF